MAWERLSGDLKGQLYGGSIFTLEHAMFDGSEPDLIKNRIKDGVFEGYVQNLTAILATKYGQFDTKKINSARSKLMELGKYAEKHNVSLIGIINYEVAVYETTKLSMIDGPDVEIKTHIGTEFTIRK